MPQPARLPVHVTPFAFTHYPPAGRDGRAVPCARVESRARHQDSVDVILVGIDTGGTFTDFVVVRGDDFAVLKVPSTPDDPSRAILSGIAQLGLDGQLRQGNLRIVHGSTVATNAVLEGKLARTLYVTNRGFEDVLELGRQARADLYALQPAPDPVVAPRELRHGTGGRMTHDGTVLEPLTDADLAALSQCARDSGAEAAAVNLLYSYVNADNEKLIERQLAATLFVSRSSFVMPEYREYERGIATYLNAALGPGIAAYLTALQRAAGASRLAIMMSSGGTIAADHAAQRAVTLLLSGPAGGLVAAARLGALLGEPRLLTFDMGGTSTDVALIDGAAPAAGGGVRLTQEGRIGSWPVAIPMADIHTIGAGGGSIARVDEGGLLQVGPESAGAVPGPACYGRGGTRATVTDANLVLGRLRPESFLAGGMPLDTAAARAAVAPIARHLNLTIEAAALGIVRVANEHMVQALRVISVERGEDPRRFSLCCYGGAGGLHVCALADALAIRSILLPPSGAVFSALGMIQARPARHLSRSLCVPLADARVVLPDALASLSREAVLELAGDGWPAPQIELLATVDLRYVGQSYWLSLTCPAATGAPAGTAQSDSAGTAQRDSATEIDWPQALQAMAERFHERHAARYGHRIDTTIELVNVRVAASGPLPQVPDLRPAPPLTMQPASTPGERGDGQLSLVRRADLGAGMTVAGVALITEPYTTTLVEDGWQASIDGHACLHLTRIT